MASFVNVCRFTAASSGTGNFVVSAAVTGYQTPASAGAVDGAIYRYRAESADLSQWEVGYGAYTAGTTTLARTTILSNSAGDASAINFSAAPQVAVVALAEDLVFISPPQGRLTLQTATPVMTSGSSSATTIYYTPYVGRQVPIYDGTAFRNANFTELSVVTTDTTKSPAAIGASKVNDWFVWDDAGTLRIGHGPDWTSDTARSAGTALVRVHGILLNNAAITNGPAASRGTYVGTTRSNGASALDWRIAGSASGGTAGLYAVWNMYNRITVAAAVIDSGTSYTYTSVDFRQARASAGNQVAFVMGLAEDGISASYIARLQTVAVTSAFGQLVPALDTTTTPTTLASAWVNISAVATTTIHTNTISVAPQLGFHYIAALEGSDGTNANTFANTGKNTLTATLRM